MTNKKHIGDALLIRIMADPFDTPKTAACDKKTKQKKIFIKQNLFTFYIIIQEVFHIIDMLWTPFNFNFIIRALCRVIDASKCVSLGGLLFPFFTDSPSI